MHKNHTEEGRLNTDHQQDFLDRKCDEHLNADELYHIPDHIMLAAQT